MNWYVKTLSNQPYIILLASGLVSILAIVLSTTLSDLPDFRDPQAGFEARGTEISDRLVAWDRLLDSVSHVGPLVSNPNRISKHRSRNKQRNGEKRKNKNKKRQRDRQKRQAQPREVSGELEVDQQPGKSDLERMVASSSVQLFNATLSPHLVMRHEKRSLPEIEEIVYDNKIAWLCGEPSADFVHLVYKSVRGTSLFTRSNIVSMCALETRYWKNQKEFTELCEAKGPADCCPGWSLGGYIALLHNRTSCFTIQDSDVAETLQLVKDCHHHYQEGKLTADCLTNPMHCLGIPPRCIEHNAVYTILHFLTDDQFPSPQGTNNESRLTYAMSFLPVARSSATINFYTNLEGHKLCDGVTEIIAMDFGLKEELFNKYLLEDAKNILVSLVLIFLAIWLFTTSLTITLAALSSILFSLVLAYFIYTFIFQLKFFPFMNILAVVIAIGVGADDTFILAKVWTQKQLQFKDQNPVGSQTLEQLVWFTLRHASLSMLVTSLTTAAAFFGSIVSNITAIKCFSVFAGMTILCNLVLMVTWVPSWMVLHNKLMAIKITNQKLPPPHPSIQAVTDGIGTFFSKISGFITSFFEKVLPCIIFKPRLAWIIFLGGLVVFSLVAFFYYPGIRLPNSSTLQLLTSDHPFEIYDLKLREKFEFEKYQQKQFSINMPLRFVWGVKPTDNGNKFNPGEKGEIEMDPDFDLASAESQSWMYKFCQDIRRQHFYKQTYSNGPLPLANCFIVTFKEWMSRPCYNDLSKEQHRPCCRDSKFPFTREVFTQCLPQAVTDLYSTPSDLWLPGTAGPKFNIHSKNVSAVIIEFDSNLPFTFGYKDINTFYTAVNTWFQESLTTAPDALKTGFFVSYLEFYDLQGSLLTGTYISIAVAMIVSFFVLFISTQNLVLSLFAIGTVFSTIIVTLAILLLLGWELNILESVTISLAIGLAVDFPLHYAIMYKLATDTDREKCVTFSVSTMGSPVSMAAATTFLAGICLLPSRVLAYIQIGTFIVVLMITSWIFSTFFFQSLLGTWGPREKQCFKIPYLEEYCCTFNGGQEEPSDGANGANKQAYTLSESVISQVSNSSISYQLEAGPQEMDPKSSAECLLSTGARAKKRCQSYSRQMEAGDGAQLPVSASRSERFTNGGHRSRSLDLAQSEVPLTSQAQEYEMALRETRTSSSPPPPPICAPDYDLSEHGLGNPAAIPQHLGEPQAVAQLNPLNGFGGTVAHPVDVAVVEQPDQSTNSLDRRLLDQQSVNNGQVVAAMDLNVTTTTVVATLHSQPPAVVSWKGSGSTKKLSKSSPSRKSLEDPYFVSDGQTIRSDPYHTMSLKKKSKEAALAVAQKDTLKSTKSLKLYPHQYETAVVTSHNQTNAAGVAQTSESANQMPGSQVKSVSCEDICDRNAAEEASQSSIIQTSISVKHPKEKKSSKQKKHRDKGQKGSRRHVLEEKQGAAATSRPPSQAANPNSRPASQATNLNSRPSSQPANTTLSRPASQAANSGHRQSSSQGINVASSRPPSQAANLVLKPMEDEEIVNADELAACSVQQEHFSADVQQVVEDKRKVQADILLQQAQLQKEASNAVMKRRRTLPSSTLSMGEVNSTPAEARMTASQEPALPNQSGREEELSLDESLTTVCDQQNATKPTQELAGFQSPPLSCPVMPSLSGSKASKETGGEQHVAPGSGTTGRKSAAASNSSSIAGASAVTGTIPKHSRKKSLPEDATRFFYRSDSTNQTPYELIAAAGTTDQPPNPASYMRAQPSGPPPDVVAYPAEAASVMGTYLPPPPHQQPGGPAFQMSGPQGHALPPPPPCRFESNFVSPPASTTQYNMSAVGSAAMGGPNLYEVNMMAFPVTYNGSAGPPGYLIDHPSAQMGGSTTPDQMLNHGVVGPFYAAIPPPGAVVSLAHHHQRPPAAFEGMMLQSEYKMICTSIGAQPYEIIPTVPEQHHIHQLQESSPRNLRSRDSGRKTPRPRSSSSAGATLQRQDSFELDNSWSQVKGMQGGNGRLCHTLEREKVPSGVVYPDYPIGEAGLPLSLIGAQSTPGSIDFTSSDSINFVRPGEESMIQDMAMSSVPTESQTSMYKRSQSVNNYDPTGRCPPGVGGGGGQPVSSLGRTQSAHPQAQGQPIQHQGGGGQRKNKNGKGRSSSSSNSQHKQTSHSMRPAQTRTSSADIVSSRGGGAEMGSNAMSLHRRITVASGSGMTSKAVHPLSKSTETILFHSEDHDPNPIVPNKKPGTPDVWLPRTARA